MRDRQINPKQMDEGTDKPLSLPERQMENFAKHQTTRYSSIGIQVGPASGISLTVIDPVLAGMGVKPDGEATAINESGGILAPVTEAVLGTGCFLFHTKRLPAGPLPSTVMQQSSSHV
jgi:hypothetical protein